MRGQRKVVFLGICAGDRDLIRSWAANGELPNLAALLKTGLVGETEGLPGFYVGAHWPSWASGCTPARSRVYSWEQLRLGTYDHYRVVTGEVAQVPQFWDALGAAGRRTCVLDIPLSYISPQSNGLQTVEWGAHDAVTGFSTSSPELRTEIVERFGLHPVSGNSDADRTPEEALAFRDTLIDGVQRKSRLTRHLLAKEDWDFFAQVFTETHCAGHLLWHLHDPDHPRHAERIEDGDPLKDVYRAVDRAVGEILAVVDEETILMVLANHGMGPKYGAQFMLDKILIALGAAAPAPTAQHRPGARDHLDRLLTKGWQLTPGAARRMLQPLRKRTLAWVAPDRRPPPTIDPATSQCFVVQNNSSHGGIRVNLVGREPLGTVQPGAECSAVLDRLTEQLLALVHEGSNEAVVRSVYRTDDLYSGPEREHLPDLLVEWSNDRPTRAVVSPTIGRVEGEYRYCRTGDHKPGGMFIVRGPGTLPGTVDGAVSCVDFAPTIGALLDVPLPDVDGRIIEPVLRAAQSGVRGP